MMYLKQFPDICREMGFDVEEKAKTITLRITDINYSIDINKKLFLEDLELTLGKTMRRKFALSSMNFSRGRTLLTATVFWQSFPSRLDTLPRSAEFFSKRWAKPCRTSRRKPTLT